ncbi:MAG: hypothetical protein K8I27_00555 [Planctomycetes bacterium]|nr:hypothetical protein [Planctomycetota bacterium]
MPGDDDTSIEWLERDSRPWVLFALQPDQLTARMTITYLEAGGIEARVGTTSGHYCVEVPQGQLEQARAVYTPAESGVMPPMQEISRKTGVHTGVHLKLRLTEPRRKERKRAIGKWALRLAVVAGITALLLLIID